MSSSHQRRGSASLQHKSRKLPEEYSDIGPENEEENDYGRQQPSTRDGTSIVATAIALDEGSYGYSGDPPEKGSNSSSRNGHNKTRSNSLKGGQPQANYAKRRDISFSSPPAASSKSWPSALRSEIVRSFERSYNAESGGQFLKDAQWPEGLAQTVFKSCTKIAIRFFIVDDSGVAISVHCRVAMA